MRNMTPETVCRACNGTLFLVKEDGSKTTIFEDAAVRQELQGAVIDSRLVKEGDLFFATPGERVDGHDFIGKAFDLGALAVVCQRIPEGVAGLFILVEDSFVALKQIAEFYRANLTVKVVGITGSVGKTSTKEFVASVLAQKYRVLKTEGNFNNEVGLPLTVLKIRDEHEVAVLEMGISDFGEMSRLARIAKPDLCVITNIGQCHLENLGDRDGVLKAKTEVFAYLKEGGRACLFGDDDKLATCETVNGLPAIFFGTGEGAAVTGGNIVNLGLKGSTCSIHTEQGSFDVKVPLPGSHMVTNALAATAVGLELGLSTEEIRRGIETVPAVSGRSHIIHTDKITIIDDCYNANPVSMKAALTLLKEGTGGTVALLGDMFELGEKEKELHYEVGAFAKEIGIDKLVCIGDLSEHMALGAGGADGESVFHYATKEAFMAEKDRIIKEGNAVLVKASHGMHFEEILTVLEQF